MVIKVCGHTRAIIRKLRKPAALKIMEKRNFLRGVKIFTILLGLTLVVNELNSCTRVLLNSWMTKVKSPFSSVPRNFSLDSFLGSDMVLQPDDFREVTSERLIGISGKILTPDLSLTNTERATVIADAISKSRGVLHSTAFDSADWLRIYVYEVPTAFTTDLGCNSSFKKSVSEWSSGDGGVIGSWMAMYQLERVSPRKFLDQMQGSSFSIRTSYIFQ